MNVPTPKSKLDEVSKIIYNNPDNVYLSEFQAARLEKMTKDAESVDFLRAKKHRMLIYYQSGQYVKAKAELNSLIPYVSGDGNLYIFLLAIAVRIGAFSDLSRISANLDAEAVLSLPQSHRVPVLTNMSTFSFFTGGFEGVIMNLSRIVDRLIEVDDSLEASKLKQAQNQLQASSNIYRSLNIEDAKVNRLAETIEKFIVKHKIRVLGIMPSTPEDELLIDLGVSNSVQEIIGLNNKLFDLVYEQGLVDEFNTYSINFSPITKEQMKDVIM